jgi:hypothetical protein
MRWLLQFIFTDFATIEMEERIEVRPKAEPTVPEAIWFRS